LIFYSAMIGGWAAFFGWMISEILLIQRSVHDGFWGFLVIVLTGALVGGCIAGGLTLLGGVASGSFSGQWLRFLPGFAGGAIGGALGSMLGNAIYSVLENPVVQLFGWTLMGLAIGAVEGIYDKSSKKLRNGLIGGGVGGILGGIIFILLGAGRTMGDRATGFVILGMCIGCFIGLAQVILKEAWLTVENGFRPGRQLVLSMPEIIMGTSEKAALPFIAFGAKGVEPIHLRIMRRDDGSYVLQDNNSRTGTFVNGRQVHGAVLLKNDDTIQLGVNVVRFREAHRHVSSGAPAPPPAAPPPAASPRVPTAAVTAAVPKAVVTPAAAPPARPKPPPTGAGPKPSPMAAGPAPTKAPPPGAAPRPPRPAAPAPAAPAAASPSAAAAVPAAKGCPICGRSGVAVPQSTKRRCASCGILY
jgi:hypothetical protein